jgi:hypothetical protein
MDMLKGAVVMPISGLGIIKVAHLATGEVGLIIAQNQGIVGVDSIQPIKNIGKGTLTAFQFKLGIGKIHGHTRDIFVTTEGTCPGYKLCFSMLMLGI